MKVELLGGRGGREFTLTFHRRAFHQMDSLLNGDFHDFILCVLLHDIIFL